ncbi:MAG: adenine phosphoribosyltransferase [Deltaproteobacteria bacterium]|nr:adenine phosphoribosyltransferase [Deltaproteobacteria bacterium]
MSESLRRLIRDVPDFPKPGILFRDITPLLANGPALREAVEAIAEPWRGKVDVVLGIESRGFILGAPVAVHLGVGLAIVRKPGKLPSDIRQMTYDLEYGTDTLEIHSDAVAPGSRVLLVDDLLATGGTAAASVQLIRALEGKPVGASFLIELGFLSGRERLAPVPVHTVIRYD